MTLENKPLIKLRKVTVSYSPIEDRIRMTAQTDDGESIEFWLTLRLCREVIKVMAEQLSASVLKKTQARHAPMVESFLQTGAASRKTAARPVTVKPSQSHVLHKVQVQSGKQSLFLRIPTDNGTAVLPFTHDEARQWLAILHKQFRLARWPMDIWPEWVSKAQQDAEPKHQNAVH
jgi:hypothetical protein